MQRQSVWLYPVGGGLIVLGLLMILFGIFSRGAPEYSETLNIGLLNDKTNITIAGGFAFTSGIICLAVESLARRLINALAGIFR